MELDIAGQSYSTIGKLDAFTQLHIARRLGSALPIVEGLVANANKGKDMNILTVLMLSHISDEDTEYVLRKCLSVVGRRQEKGISKLTAKDGSLMFDDLPMDGMLKLTVAVIEENLGDFFREALSSLDQVAQQKA